MTVGTGDPTLTFELKEFIKEQLITVPMGSRALVPAAGPAPPVAQPPSPAALADDPGAMLAGLL
jgi:AP-2 complex subunit alpha